MVKVPISIRKVIFKNLTGKCVAIETFVDDHPKGFKLVILADTMADLCLCERQKNPICKHIAKTLHFQSGRRFFFETTYEKSSEKIQVLVRDTHELDIDMYLKNRRMTTDREICDRQLLYKETGLKLLIPIFEFKFTCTSRFSLDNHTYEAGDNILCACTCNTSSPSERRTTPYFEIAHNSRRYNLRIRATLLEKCLEEASNSYCVGIHWVILHPFIINPA